MATVLGLVRGRGSRGLRAFRASQETIGGRATEVFRLVWPRQRPILRALRYGVVAFVGAYGVGLSP
jgi:hypothetical protein